MKILFLDMDGVANSDRYKLIYQSPTMLPDLENIDPEAAKLLDTFLLQHPTIQIVMCSTWKNKFSLSEIRGALKVKGLSCAERIIDATPRLSHTTNKGSEILAWLSTHPEVTHYAILDDGEDFAEVKDKHIQTKMETGVTNSDLEKVSNLLKG